MSPDADFESEVCQQCGDGIEGQPLYPVSDIEPTEDGLTYVEDPDGPFCGIDCRRDYDGE